MSFVHPAPKMEKLLVWILLQLLEKVTSSKLSLDIQVHVQQFENMHNLVILDGLYCCCDSLLCFENISNVNTGKCNALCDTYFKTYTTDCSNDYSSFVVCNLTTSIFYDSPSVINWPIIDLSLLMSSSKTQNGLKIEAWKYEPYHAAMEIDRFTVPMPATVLNNTQSSSITIPGDNGIGKLTLIYQNVSNGNISCNSADQLSSNTCSNSEEDCNYIYSTSTCTSCPVSSKWMISTTEEVTVTLLQTSATVTMSPEVAMILLLWKTMAILLIVVAMSLAITSIALSIIAYHLRKTVNSEPNSKFTTHKELKTSNVAIVDGMDYPVYDTVNTDTSERLHTPDPAKRDVLDHMYNTLYQQKGVSDCEYFNTGTTDIQGGKLYDLAYTTEDKLATFCETSLPLDQGSENSMCAN